MMTRWNHPRRLLLPALSALLMVVLSTQGTLAAVTWTAPVASGPGYGYNFGMGLARTSSSTASYLHEQYVFENTYKAGVYYRRGNSTGSSWGVQKRMNVYDGFAANGAIAAATSSVYVAYQVVNGPSNPDFDWTAPRSIALRVNTNHGAGTAWLDERTLSSATRVGRPAAAASGGYGYVVYTDADSGDIVLATNGGVNAAGRSWTSKAIGVTANLAGNNAGYEGEPVVAATGALVVVAWVPAQAGTIVARISHDHGKTWQAGPPTTLTTAEGWSLSASGVSGRVGIAWAQGGAVRAKLYRNGAWKGTHTVATFSATGTYKAGYGTAIALAGTGRVGVAWSACTRVGCSAGSTYGVDVRWRESSDNLASWKGPVTIASHTAGTARRWSHYPSVVFTNTPRRYVTYEIQAADGSTFSMLFELGKG